MELVRELSPFYKVIVALGFTALIAIICFVIFLLGCAVYSLWCYEDKKKRANKRILVNLKVRIDNLERKCDELDECIVRFAKDTKVKKEVK